MKEKKIKSLVIIPAFNEEASIRSVVEKIKAIGYDYLVINDCSSDNTEKILTENDYNHLRLPINLGIAGVTQVGFKYALDNDYDCVVCIDGDGQHDPSYIPSLTEKIENGREYVVGSRFIEEKKPFNMRMIGSRMICFLIRLKTGKKATDPTSGMRALGRRVIKEFAESMNFYAEPDALCYLLHHKFDVEEVQVQMKEREGGESYFRSPFKSLYFMISVMLSIIFVQ